MRDSGLFKQAHEEFKVTRQTSTGNGSLYCGQVTGPKSPDVPGWFIREELGYDGPVGVRLYKMLPQEVIEGRHRRAAQQEQKLVPAPDIHPSARKPPRETKATRRAKLEQLEARALAMRYAA